MVAEVKIGTKRFIRLLRHVVPLELSMKDSVDAASETKGRVRTREWKNKSLTQTALDMEAKMTPSRWHRDRRAHGQ